MKGILVALTLAILFMSGAGLRPEHQVTYLESESIVENTETEIVENNQVNESINNRDVETALSDLEGISQSIVLNDKNFEINKYFEAYIASSSLDIVTVYLGTEEGNFYLMPHAELPESYDSRERPWYKYAIENGVYISDTYEDIMTNETIQTVAIVIKKEGVLLGVIAMDYNVAFAIESK